MADPVQLEMRLVNDGGGDDRREGRDGWHADFVLVCAAAPHTEPGGDVMNQEDSGVAGARHWCKL
ncbi:hypothetical protein E4U26_004518 [Claviceps purpurea]|nr:hypothetical protein E4U51_003444 [Claviceps purpurea]KAG6223501.1 hypothetical protein E4U26_004518 [Claviceps purpurea]